jgi:hypothetical protein
LKINVGGGGSKPSVKASPASSTSKVSSGGKNSGSSVGASSKGTGKGVDPKHHNANVRVQDSNGKTTSRSRYVSGNMTPEEKALGFPKNTLASHTEARAVKDIKLKPGETMTITGQRPPCPSCKGKMNNAVKESGADINYQWRQNGQTQKWSANKKK